MRALLIAVVLLAVAVAVFYRIASLVVEFSHEQPDFSVAVAVLTGVLACVAAVGILVGASRANRAMHRVVLALLIPVSIVIATLLIISGLGVVLLTFAGFTWECTGVGADLHCEATELITSVKEFYAVVCALLVATAILGVSTYLARRSAETSQS